MYICMCTHTYVLYVHVYIPVSENVIFMILDMVTGMEIGIQIGPNTRLF